MRDIKFRAWEYGCLMTYSPEFTFYLKYHHCGDSIDVAINQALRSVSVLMQYTGLKDKNGKEIYEGDLYKTVYKAGYSIYEVCFGEYSNGGHYEDEISGNGWYLKETAYWTMEKVTTDIEDFYADEVVGNIYENPELGGTDAV